MLTYDDDEHLSSMSYRNRALITVRESSYLVSFVCIRSPCSSSTAAWMILHSFYKSLVVCGITNAVSTAGREQEALS